MHDVRDVKRLYFSGKSYYLLAMFNPNYVVGAIQRLGVPLHRMGPRVKTSGCAYSTYNF